MQKNVGDMDAYLRLTGGFTLLGLGVLDRSRFMVLLGAMKLAEGITRFCPMLHMLGMNTLGDKLVQEEKTEAEQQNSSNAGRVADVLFTE